MADIFISYANEDRETAARFAQMLESVGWRVWWDRRIPAGRTWRSILESALRDMRCMVVLWSANSVESPWVTEEAEEARRLGKTIVPVLIERIEPPIGFRAIQAADLSDWNGSSEDPAAQRFIADLKSILGDSVETSGSPSELRSAENSELSVKKTDGYAPKIVVGMAVALFAGFTGWQISRHFEPKTPISAPAPEEKTGQRALPTPTTLTISGARKELRPTEKFKLELSATDSDGKQAQVRDEVTWSSSAPEVATVSQTGEIVGLGVGTTVITARTGELVSAPWTVTVKPAEDAQKPPMAAKLISLNISAGNRELFTKEKTPIRVQGRYSDNTERFLSSGIEWQISNHAVASISPGGELQALRPGKVEVAAHSGDLSSSPLLFIVKQRQINLQPPVKAAKIPDGQPATVAPPSSPPPPSPLPKPQTTPPPAPKPLQAVSEQDKARIAAYLEHAGSLREQGNYAAASAELERARILDPSNESVRKAIEQTRRACNAERVLGNPVNC